MGSSVSLLPGQTKLALFVTSFLPLFLLLALRQIAANSAAIPDLLKMPLNAITQGLMRHFGMTVVLGALSLYGIVGTFALLRGLRRSASSGIAVRLTDIRDRNAEAISYIGTYIIPFLFEDYNSWDSILSLCVLLTVIYLIYANSSLMLVNPVLSLRYSLLEVEFEVSGVGGLTKRPKTGIIICENRELEVGDQVALQLLSRKLYFAHSPQTRTKG